MKAKKPKRVKAVRCTKGCGVSFAAEDPKTVRAAQRQHDAAVHSKSGTVWQVWKGRSD